MIVIGAVGISVEAVETVEQGAGIGDPLGIAEQTYGILRMCLGETLQACTQDIERLDAHIVRHDAVDHSLVEGGFVCEVISFYVEQAGLSTLFCQGFLKFPCEE